MIQRVYERVSGVLDDVAVATDDNRIAAAVGAFGGRVVMTSAEHRSGTDRVREAADILATDADVVINIQGDEPFIAPSQIEALKACFDTDPALGFDALFDPNLVKVVMGDKGNALYFSRSIIPYVRSTDWQHWLEKQTFYTHVGIYAYRREVLRAIASLPQSPLELAESLEQLRWLSAGYTIRMAVTNEPTIGIDTPADLEAAVEYLKQHPQE